MLLVTLQVFKLVILVLVGVMVLKLKILPESSIEVLSKLLINVTLPILTFFSIASFNLTGTIVKDGLVIILFGVIIQVLNLIFGIVLAKKYHLNDKKKNVYAAQFMIGNTVYLAFPLMTSLHGETGLIYAIIYYLISLLFIWTLGIYMFSKHQIKSLKDIGKSLINPCTTAFSLGITFLLLDMDALFNQVPLLKEIYYYLYEALNPLGQTTMSLSMIFIGLIIGRYKLKQIIEIFKDSKIVVLTIVKMILVPAIIIGISNFLTSFVSQIAISVIVVESLMPASTITVAIAREHNSDYKFAMEIAILTTVVAIVTIPIMLQVFEILKF